MAALGVVKTSVRTVRLPRLVRERLIQRGNFARVNARHATRIGIALGFLSGHRVDLDRPKIVIRKALNSGDLRA